MVNTIPQLFVTGTSKPEAEGVPERSEASISRHKYRIRTLIKLHRDGKIITPWRNGISHQTATKYVEYGILNESNYEYNLTEKFKEFLKDHGISPQPPNQDIVDFLKFEPVCVYISDKIEKIEYENQDCRAEINRLQNALYWNSRKIDKLKSKLSCVNRRAARERYRKIPITRNIPNIDDICASLRILKKNS